MFKGKLMIDVHHPLFENLGFDSAPAPIVTRNPMRIIFVYFYKKSFFFEFLNNSWSGLFDMHTSKVPSNRKKLPFKINNLFFIKMMAIGYIVISFIMPRGNGHYSRAKIHINCLVFYNGGGEFASNPLDLHLFTLFILFISRICWMHYYIFITKFCFGTNSRDYKWTILEVIQGFSYFFPFEFVV